MSGLEVVGVVLGTLPLAIQALEAYRDVFASVRNAKRDLASLVRILETEQLVLQNTCENLLVGIAPPLMIDTMINNPFGPEWKRFDNQIRLRLWKSSGKFAEQVTEMSLAVSELKGKLNIGQDGQSKLTDRPSILRELKQGAAFTLKKKDYESLLSRIKDGNSVLQDLTRQNYVLEPSRRHRSQLRVIRLMRRLTQSIFNALLNSTTCKCVRPHHVGLELTSRNMVLIPDDDDDQAAKRLDFNVIWGNHGDSIKVGTGSSSQNAAKTYPRTCWESFRIQLADMAQEKQASSPVIAQGVGPDATAKVARRVKWSHSVSFRSRKQVTISGTQTSVVEARSPTVVPILGDHVFSEVSNLCRIFPGCKGSAVDCYGYINDVERRFWLYPRLQRAGPCTTYTLRELLEDKGPLNGAFGYQEKLNVALALSVSVMHLHNTRWLAGKISLDDVIFLLDDEAPLSQGYSPYQPFMTRNLMGESTNRTEHPGPPRRILRPINLTILSLAALLIQVIIGSVVNALELAGNLDISTILSKTEAAGQLASHTRELGGPNYENAVKWCLKSVLEVAGFEDDNFCQEFYGGVVALLETDAKLLRLID